MNKGKKEKKKEGKKKNTEFVTSWNWVVRFAISYYTYFSPLRVHLYQGWHTKLEEETEVAVVWNKRAIAQVLLER